MADGEHEVTAGTAEAPQSEEQWLNAPELTLSAGMTDEEIRAVAVQAAATFWAPERGAQHSSVLRTAAAFADYIRDGIV